MYLPAQILGNSYDVNILYHKVDFFIFSVIILPVDSGFRMIKNQDVQNVQPKAWVLRPPLPG